MFMSLIFLLKFIVDQPTDNYKRIYFYNGVIDQWVELPSYADGPEMVKSIIHLPYAKMVILAEETMQTGAASWYKYKGCNCAASPDYPKGSILKVTNLHDERSVIVTVNDYGPDRTIHPDRVIDLDAVAFKQIGELWQGLIPEVKVDLIELPL
jgi:rare lipoprotein A (peptidoglycan hydrolase)